MDKDKKKIVVVGGGGHAGVIVSMLVLLDGFEIAGFVDPDADCALKTMYPHLPHLGGEEALAGILAQGGADCAVIAVGSVGRDTEKRAALFERVKAMGFSFPVIVSTTAVVDSTATLGAGTVVMPGAIVNRGAVTGENCIINTGAIVEHDTKIGAHSHLASGARTGGAAMIEDKVHVGTGAVIIQKIRIGTSAVIGAGAVAIRDVSAGALAVGVPAREKAQ